MVIAWYFITFGTWLTCCTGSVGFTKELRTPFAGKSESGRDMAVGFVHLILSLKSSIPLLAACVYRHTEEKQRCLIYSISVALLEVTNIRFFFSILWKIKANPRQSGGVLLPPSCVKTCLARQFQKRY